VPAENDLLMSAARVRWHARWVVPVSSPPIADGTVITEGSRIAWVGPRATAPAGGHDEDLGDAILAPGIVNAHTHLDLTSLRGTLDGLPFFDWVRTLTRARAALSDDALLAAARDGITEGLLAGITTYGDTAPNSASFDAMLALGVRGIAYREVFGPDPAQAQDSLRGLREQVHEMRARETALVKVGVSPHAPYSVSDALFRAVAEYAAAENLPVAVHIAESEAESQLVEKGEGPFADFLRSRSILVRPRGSSPVDALNRSGIIRAHTLLIHAIRVHGAEIPLLAGSGCGIAHCPASNAKLAHGTAPLAEFVAAGARVGLGSDSMASNDRMDILEEARLAVLAQRARGQPHDTLNARAALRLATLGGAEALRLDAEVGSIEVGKQADLAAFATPTHTGTDDPVHALVFGARPLIARRVVVAGVVRVRDGAVSFNQ
jgi:cytosine/adenosine deaminase-related metal-dependent hydrolase